MSSNLIAAVVHADGVYPLSVIRHAVAPLRRQGTALAGVIALESTDEAGLTLPNSGSRTWRPVK
jgi:hypothetical protein